ncbi:MAG TPA: Holliday junction resolvase RuvX [Anaerolineales bacterium]|jgi:putative Holliday junction resolvase|nr:Holliday junction resolvase RuvX [Anaerolineales bacterium]
MSILAVDPGSKRIGLALSDPSGSIANPLAVIEHVSRPLDAATIAQIAREHKAKRIVVGQSLDEQGQPTLEGRRATRLAAALRSQIDLPVELWDESFSTQEARAAYRAMGVSQRRRRGHMDELAATVILQTYLDAHRNEP